MPHKEKHRHQISPLEHYTVYLALIISLLTTFTIGVLFTGSMFQPGVDYFSNMRSQNAVQSANAASKGWYCARMDAQCRQSCSSMDDGKTPRVLVDWCMSDCNTSNAQCYGGSST